MTRRGGTRRRDGIGRAAAKRRYRRRVARVLHHRTMGEESGGSSVYIGTPGRRLSLLFFIVRGASKVSVRILEQTRVVFGRKFVSRKRETLVAFQWH